MELHHQSRLIYLVLLGFTIAVGLMTRSVWVPEDTPLNKYAGDTLWAVALYWSVTIIFPHWRTGRLFFATITIAFAVELSQLYHAEWIDRLRSMKLGELLLGFTFRWQDLVCYTAGAALAALIDWQILRKERQSPWQWWLTTGIKEKFLCWGALGMTFSLFMLTLNLVELKILGTSCALLFVGFLLPSEDSTDI